jgi:hypothetical protein
MMGIMWGTGENAITVEPSDALLEKVAEEDVRDWFKWMTDRTLFHVNHPQSGTNAALKSHNYDQFAFGTSGIGAYPNPQFKNRIEENALIMRSYGIDTIAIDEGKSGLVDVIFVTYQWRTNRVVEEFALDANGSIDKKKFAKLPLTVQKDYKGNQVNTEHKIVQAIYPREDYNPTLKGKKGSRYRGSWFKDEDGDNVFHEEDYKVFPVAIARAIKVRGEVYGRASGTILMGTIASVDFIVSETFDILAKMQDPAMGVWNSALFGDSVLDTSANGLTVFNQEMIGGAKDPLFPIHDIGDPTGIITFLIPYLNEKITTAFKIDVLLDFNAPGDRTATEMMQRAIIRGKNLAGMLNQQKTELYDRWLDRCISLLWGMKVYGIDESEAPDIAEDLRRAERGERIIPEAVIECENQGIKWYKIRYNGELDRLTKTEALEKIMTCLNAVGSIATMYPQIIEAINWYDMMVDVNKYLGISYFKSEDEFKAIVDQQAQAQKLAMAAEIQNTASGTANNMANADKSRQEAQA